MSALAISRRRPRTNAAVTVLLAGLLLLLPAGAASAHVRVHPDSTTTGSWSALTFRVPTESDTASTTKLQVQLPQDTPFLSVSVKPVPGWTAAVTEAKLPTSVTVEGTTLTKAPRTVTWTADNAAAAIKPGQYQEFSISAGPLPRPGTILLPATQTYSDGTVVKWDEPTPASGAEPEHPAPSIIVTAATGTTAKPAAADTGDSNEGTSWVSLAALVVALIAALLGGAALVSARRTTLRTNA